MNNRPCLDLIGVCESEIETNGSHSVLISMMEFILLNVVIVAQKGRLLYQALLFAYSFKKFNDNYHTKLFICMPENSDLWNVDPTIDDERALNYFRSIGAELRTFKNDHFGSKYPNSNKIYAISKLPENEPFIFFDSDIIITGNLLNLDLDFNKPSGLGGGYSWPKLDPVDSPEREEIWKGVYDYMGLDFQKSINDKYKIGIAYRYMYFNGGFFYYKCPKKFYEHYSRNMIKLMPHLETLGQTMFPWLDQIALGVTCSELGGVHGGVPVGTIDKKTSFHYHFIPTLLTPNHGEQALEVAIEAKNDNEVGELLKAWEPFQIFLSDEGRKMVNYIAKTEGARNRHDLANILKKLKIISRK